MSSLAISGGTPVRTAPFPTWPVFGSADEKALTDVLHSGRWFMADRLATFEKAFAQYQEAEFGVAVSSGTTALQIALEAAGVGIGDEVIVPAYTFIATASAVALIGAVPVFVDIEPGSYNIDPDAVEAAITERTRAVVAVHIAGRPANLDRLTALAQKHNIRLIEDAAQAHAAAWKGKRVGAIGDLGTFSFQASKNLNAGEGGFITSSNRELAERAWSLHNCGRSRQGAWYEHALVGSNYRLSEFQAGLLLSQLESLDEQTQRRTRNGQALGKLLDGIEGISPTEPDKRVTTHAYHLFIMRYRSEAFKGVSRNRFIEALQKEGIPCSSGYQPLYREAAFASRFADYPLASPYFAGKPDYSAVHCPVTERVCAEEAIWLTQNMLLGEESDMADIAAAIKKIQTHAEELL
jgi:dTDP-4-amino-4,6-dideoxygalactose transaminase